MYDRVWKLCRCDPFWAISDLLSSRCDPPEEPSAIDYGPPPEPRAILDHGPPPEPRDYGPPPQPSPIVDFVPFTAEREADFDSVASRSDDGDRPPPAHLDEYLYYK